MKFLVPALLFFVLAYHGVNFWQHLRLEQKRFNATEELSRLQRATMEAFQGKPSPTEQEFWNVLNKSVPMQDPWGLPYRILKKENFLLWQSAGSDGQWDTKDDLSKIVLLNDGKVLYLKNNASSEGESSGRVIDAK